MKFIVVLEKFFKSNKVLKFIFDKLLSDSEGVFFLYKKRHKITQIDGSPSIKFCDKYNNIVYYKPITECLYSIDDNKPYTGILEVYGTKAFIYEGETLVEVDLFS